jgi:hypothetical protein
MFFVLGLQFLSHQDLVLRSFSLLALHWSAPVIFSSLSKIALSPSDFLVAFFHTMRRVGASLCRHIAATSFSSAAQCLAPPLVLALQSAPQHPLCSVSARFFFGSLDYSSIFACSPVFHLAFLLPC